MQKEQQKRPYLAPEIISVEFSVERGMNATSVPQEAELGVMQIGYLNDALNPNNLYMGGPMSDLSTGGYFGYGEYSPGHSPAPSGGGYFTGGGGYF